MTHPIVGPVHYRLRDDLHADGVYVSVMLFKPVVETPCGYWVLPEYSPEWRSLAELRKARVLKWVSKSSVKRLCYPSLEAAMSSYRRRKEAQVSRLRSQLEQAEKVLEHFDEYKTAGVDAFRRGVNVGVILSLENFQFD